MIIFQQIEPCAHGKATVYFHHPPIRCPGGKVVGLQPAEPDYEAGLEAFFVDWRANDITDTEDYRRALRVAVETANAGLLLLQPIKDEQ